MCERHQRPVTEACYGGGRGAADQLSNPGMQSEAWESNQDSGEAMLALCLCLEQRARWICPATGQEDPTVVTEP